MNDSDKVLTYEDAKQLTTELRDRAERYCNFKDDSIVKFREEEFDCLCDNIDAIHAGLERDYATACRVNEQQDLEYADLAKRYDKTITLPLDADGVPIRIGDVMESKGSGLLFDKASFEVRIMRCDECGWEVYDRLGDRYEPSLLRHYHAPTVEDVLREFANEVYADADNEIRDRDYLCAKYAKRLTLAEGEDA